MGLNADDTDAFDTFPFPSSLSESDPDSVRLVADDEAVAVAIAAACLPYGPLLSRHVSVHHITIGSFPVVTGASHLLSSVISSVQSVATSYRHPSKKHEVTTSYCNSTRDG